MRCFGHKISRTSQTRQVRLSEMYQSQKISDISDQTGLLPLCYPFKCGPEGRHAWKKLNQPLFLQVFPNKTNNQEKTLIVFRWCSVLGVFHAEAPDCLWLLCLPLTFLFHICGYAFCWASPAIAPIAEIYIPAAINRIWTIEKQSRTPAAD